MNDSKSNSSNKPNAQQPQEAPAVPEEAAALLNNVQLVALNGFDFAAPPQPVLQQVIQAMNFIEANAARIEFNEKMEKLARRQQLVGLPLPSGAPLSVSSASPTLSSTSPTQQTHSTLARTQAQTLQSQQPSSTVKPVLTSVPASTSQESKAESSSGGNLSVDEIHWPDGNVSFEVPTEHLKRSGLPHFGWAMAHLTTDELKNGTVKSVWFCIGTFACASQGCAWRQRPHHPLSKSYFAKPPPCKWKCGAHPHLDPVWIPCTGGDPSVFRRPREKNPCVVHGFPDESTGKVTLHHFGVHNHPRPTVKNPTPSGENALRERVLANPSAGPAKLRCPNGNEPAASEIDIAFVNRRRLKGFRAKFLKENQSNVPAGSHAGRGGLASIFQWSNMTPGKFIVASEIADQHRQHFTMQSDYMRKVLNESVTGFQSNTVEGAMHDMEFVGNMDIHFTSCFDNILRQWVPVLISIVFGRSTTHFSEHWKVFFNSFDDKANSSWDSFKAAFPGVSVDWSSALGKSFIITLESHAKSINHASITRDEVRTFVKKCSVHFKRSMLRVAQNGAAVPPSQQQEFRNLIDRMCAQSTSFMSFEKTVAETLKKFPDTEPFFKWHLHPDRAMSFFPACQNLTEDDLERFEKLHSTTNAQENVGKQFQELFIINNRKLSLDECVRALWKWMNQFAVDRTAAESGQSILVSHFPHAEIPGNKKQKRAKGDHRGPDTSKALGLTKKSRFSRGRRSASCNLTLFFGPRWRMNGVATNTCPLDSWLIVIYVPHLVQSQIESQPEFEFDAFGATGMFHNLNDAKKWQREKDGCELIPDFDEHPMYESLSMEFTRKLVCLKENGCSAHRDWDSDEDSVNDGDRVEKLDKPNGVVRRVRFRTALNFKADLGAGPEEGLEHFLSERTRTGCPVRKYSNSKEELHSCNGPTQQCRVEVEKWPNTLVFQAGGSNLRLSDLPRVFCKDRKQFNLRGATISTPGHFVAAVKHPDGWVSYDGLRNVPRFKFHKENNSEEAMNFDFGRLDLVTYEVCEEDSPLHKDENFDWSEVIEAGNSWGRPTKRQPSSQEIADSLTKLTKSLQSSTRKRMASKPVKRSPKKAREPMGWSFKKTGGVRGPQIKCNGCKCPIARECPFVQHRYKKKIGHKWATTDSFHCKSDCLKKMSNHHMALFLQKKWADSTIRNLVAQLSQSQDNDEVSILSSSDGALAPSNSD